MQQPGARDRTGWPLRPADLLERFAWFETARVRPWMWVVLLWALFVFPAISLRALHYEEGTTGVLARGAFEDGYWLAYHYFGLRMIERPTLLAWVVGALGFVTGGIGQWTVRIVPVLALLAGGLLIFSFVQRRATALAGLFAAICCFVSPMILQKVVVAEPDLLLSVLLFACFVLWWNGVERGGVTLARWCAIGVILTAAALCKGPQPIAYFGLGVGAFLLWRRRWSDLIGLAVSGAIAAAGSIAWYWAVYQPGDVAVWLRHSRLDTPVPFAHQVAAGVRLIGVYAAEILPGLFVIVPLVTAMLRGKDAGETKHHDLMLALVFYSFTCTAVLLAWPGANGRYAMPSIFSIAAAAGLAFERMRAERPRMLGWTLGAATALAAYQIVLGWLVMPAFPDVFGKSRATGRLITTMVAAQPAPLYVQADMSDRNPLVYVPGPIRGVEPSELLTLNGPAWVVLMPELLTPLRATRDELDIVVDVPLEGTNPSNHLILLRGR